MGYKSYDNSIVQLPTIFKNYIFIEHIKENQNISNFWEWHTIDFSKCRTRTSLKPRKTLHGRAKQIH